MPNRRSFLSASAAGVAAATTAWLSKSAVAQTPASSAEPLHPLIIFAKPLQHLEFAELGKRLRSIGVQGIEATLRAGGQVTPENFERDLPKLVEALAKYDQRIVIASSDLNQADSATQRQLEQFAKAGIPNFRMQYYRYDYSQPILPQLDSFAKQATELAAMSKTLGIKALYQNHAGKQYVGAALWDLEQVLRGIDPQAMAVAYDVRHTSLELSQSWTSAYATIRPHIGAIYVKDVTWINNKPENVPLGQGLARPLFDAVRRDGLIGPLSLHVEYIDHTEAAMQEQRWSAVARDVDTLRTWLAS
jgi:sugar phosphate isomerase/epimerase